MCMLCVIPPNTIPSRDKLENSALNNPHGFGFAIVVPEENRIICERSMSADESINRFLELRGKYQTGYAMWHARIATSGKIDISNCHPFLLPDSEHPNTTYVGHNGMLDVYEAKDEVRSDTRIFVEDLIPALGGVTALDNIQIFTMLDEFTRGSKVCILTVHPKAEYQMYLFHEEAGHIDEDKVWWSNKSCELETRNPYLYNGYYDYGYAGAFVKDGKEGAEAYYNWYVCQTCKHEFDWETECPDDYCPKCRTCLMCESSAAVCFCYRPESKKKTDIDRPHRSYYAPEGGWAIS